jgi:hypothetical protein
MYLILIANKNKHKIWFRLQATSQKVPGSNPNQVIVVFNLPDPSSHTMTLGLIEPLTEMSTNNPRGGKARAVRKADLTAICKANV